jgi:hypothetical protein
LIKHALLALKGCTTKGLTSKSVTIAFVGKDQPFTMLEDEDVRPFLEGVADEEGGEVAGAADEEGDSSMA